MFLPEIHINNIQTFLNSAEIIEETALQIQKDFGMFGITIAFSANTPTENAYDVLHQQLFSIISDLTRNHYATLLSVLYRIDISEKEIEKAELDLPNYNLTEVVAHQIIVKELKKVLTRMYFKKRNINS